MRTIQTQSDHQPDETLAGSWQLDRSRASVGFRTRHLWGFGTVKGHFEEYRGRLDLSADRAIELTIDAASVETGNHRRDEQLRSADFFDAENHPRVRFISDLVVLRDDTMKVHGRLFARGESIPLELDAQVRRIDGEVMIEAATTVAHRELGMTWSPLGMIPPRSELHVEGYLVPAA